MKETMNDLVFVAFLLGLTLFSALWAAQWLSARRHRRRMELRLRELRSTYSLTYPNIPKPYQWKVR